ncbi:DoxX family protein [Terriglobus saanensis]|uniref:Methylamine utilisation protein MauE domain-containing protein n=1 Tax=Terriglobus saanensis (strain ATCC BAA-1853 / DSM 23119 / SP1PR4) TaxID=401053 RepID=E8V734_TERSS|nr:DoxX family protein [Terriglobus saanensis]ADV81674.1 hypothetical protein AciPR4_0841 [Terriglobus saanensis SP1PR4]
MSRLKIAGLYLQALLYVFAGINHLWHPQPYLGVMPPYFAGPAFWVAFTGYCEIAGGLGLFLHRTRSLSAWSIAAMLLGYFTVHIHMLVHQADLYPTIPVWGLWARLAFQPVLIAWALLYSGSIDADGAKPVGRHPAESDKSQKS